MDLLSLQKWNNNNNDNDEQEQKLFLEPKYT